MNNEKISKGVCLNSRTPITKGIFYKPNQLNSQHLTGVAIEDGVYLGDIEKALIPREIRAGVALSKGGIVGGVCIGYKYEERRPSQTTEDPIVCLIKGAIKLAREHPKEARAIAAGVAIGTLLYLIWDCENN
ncbi:Uncharacterised protein [uncultured archaeon]|nr:Uncharacterised protein [uncultured archaeon]